jgi:hypothetical protein
MTIRRKSARHRGDIGGGPMAVPHTVTHMVSAELPEDVNTIIKYLADSAAIYGGKVKWNEVHKFKGDLMNARGRWRRDRVPLGAFREKCLDAGLSAADTDEMVDMLTRAQNGRRLVPKWGYQKFQFALPFD